MVVMQLSEIRRAMVAMIFCFFVVVQLGMKTRKGQLRETDVGTALYIIFFAYLHPMVGL